MGGSTFENDWELTEPTSGMARTIVLVGRTGNGKSATGNTILGRKAFKSRSSSLGVTSSCELQSTVLNDGQILNVIDTPGLFDPTMDSDFVCKEIANCIKMTRDGIHSVIVVSSLRNRFTEEEKTAVLSLQSLSGTNITDSLIVLFTGGEDLEDNDESFNDYLCNDSEGSSPLKEFLSLCDNRMIFFNNKIKYELERVEQILEKLRETLERMEEQVRAEQAARLKAEKAAKEAQEKLLRAKKDLKKKAMKVKELCEQRAREAEEVRKQHAREAEERHRLLAEKNSCSILS